MEVFISCGKLPPEPKGRGAAAAPAGWWRAAVRWGLAAATASLVAVAVAVRLGPWPAAGAEEQF